MMTSRALERIIGPRIPREGAGAAGARYLLPTLLLVAAGVLLIVSIFLPYWRMTLHAPQYPRGLTVQAYLNHLDGDVREIDGLNHYIGMRPLGEAAKLERTLSVMAVAVLALLLLAAVFIHNRRAAWLALPAVLFPLGFLVDLAYWLHDFGHTLDPKAALSSAIKPFTPPVLGEGKIGQFRTVAVPDAGLILALIAAALVIAGLWFHRRAYKPLVERAVAPVLLAIALTAFAPARAFDLSRALDEAKPGDTIEVPAGTYPGPFVIDKTLDVVALPGAVLTGRGQGDVVRITASGTKLSGFTIRSTGNNLDRENSAVLVQADDVTIERNRLEDVLFGIQLKGAHRGTIRDNVVGGKDLDVSWRGDPIRLWNSDDAVITGNVVQDGRDVVVWYSKRATLTGNRVVGSRYGIHFMYCDGSRVEDNVLEDNSVGAFLMYSRDMTVRGNRISGSCGPSGYGIGLKDMDGLVAEDNRLVGNRIGIFFDNSPGALDATGSIRNNLIAYNEIGLAFQPAVRRNRVTGNTFLENGEQVAVFGGGDFHGNDFTVEGRGNFWSDYTGYDENRDGVGDLPYVSESLFESFLDRDPKLRLLRYAPAEQAIELAARAFPAFKPRPKLTDTAPLAHATVPRDASSPPAPRWPIGTLSGALLLAFGGVAAATRRFSGREPEAEVAVDREPAEVVLSIDGVTKRYGRFVALEDASLTVRRGEAVALWGENGAGKTTLIKCVLGLVRHEGRISVAGADVSSVSKDARRAIGYVPQELAFYGEWPAAELLLFLARLKGVGPDRVTAVLDEVGLSEHRDKRVGELSGGMKQRLALAAALLADPPLLVLDEITSSLDAGRRRDLLRLLESLRKRGKAILFTSHRAEEIEALGARVIRLDRGRATEGAPPRSKLSIPVDAVTRVRVLRLLADAGIPVDEEDDA